MQAEHIIVLWPEEEDVVLEVESLCYLCNIVDREGDVESQSNWE